MNVSAHPRRALSRGSSGLFRRACWAPRPDYRTIGLEHCRDCCRVEHAESPRGCTQPSGSRYDISVPNSCAIIFLCPSGGTGRRRGLKILRPPGLVGSIPISGTNSHTDGASPNAGRKPRILYTPVRLLTYCFAGTLTRPVSFQVLRLLARLSVASSQPRSLPFHP